MLDEKLLTKEINSESIFDVTVLAKGQYLLEIQDIKKKRTENNEIIYSQLII